MIGAERTPLGRVLIVGPHSSGKSTLAVNLASRLGATVVELGDVVREHATEVAGSSSLVRVAAELMASDSLFIPKAAAAIVRASEPPTVIVGPRTSVEFDALLDWLHPLVSVGLDTPVDTRRSRWQLRHLPSSDTWEERERLEGEWETSKLIPRCHVVVDGTAAIESQVKSVLQHLGCGAAI